MILEQESSFAFHEELPVYMSLANKCMTHAMYENDVEDYRNPDGFCERGASLRIMCLDKMCVVNVDAHLSREKKKRYFNKL